MDSISFHPSGGLWSLDSLPRWPGELGLSLPQWDRTGLLSRHPLPRYTGLHLGHSPTGCCLPTCSCGGKKMFFYSLQKLMEKNPRQGVENVFAPESPFSMNLAKPLYRHRPCSENCVVWGPHSDPTGCGHHHLQVYTAHTCTAGEWDPVPILAGCPDDCSAGDSTP